MDLIDPHTFITMDMDSECRIIAPTAAREIRNMRLNEFGKTGVRVSMRGTRRVHETTFDFDSLGDSDIAVNPADPEPGALELTFFNSGLFPVAVPEDVGNWNTLFDLPAYGTPFTSVDIVDATAMLYGATDIELKVNLFECGSAGAALISAVDNANCVKTLGHYCFGNFAETDISKLDIVDLPAATSYTNPSEFVECTPFWATWRLRILRLPAMPHINSSCVSTLYGTLEEVDFSSCTELGATTGDDFVFGVSGQTFTLKIPSALMTCNAGSPDGDIVSTQSSNTVTIITV